MSKSLSEQKRVKAKVKVWRCPKCKDLFWDEDAAYTHHKETGH